MLIMLESIDTWMINEDYMPELYSLQQKSINFTRHYTPLFINAGTFNTEFAALTGLLTPTSGVRKGLTRPTIFHGPCQVCSGKRGILQIHSTVPIPLSTTGAIYTEILALRITTTGIAWAWKTI